MTTAEKIVDEFLLRKKVHGYVIHDNPMIDTYKSEVIDLVNKALEYKKGFWDDNATRSEDL